MKLSIYQAHHSWVVGISTTYLTVKNNTSLSQSHNHLSTLENLGMKLNIVYFFLNSFQINSMLLTKFAIKAAFCMGIFLTLKC